MWTSVHFRDTRPDTEAGVHTRQHDVGPTCRRNALWHLGTHAVFERKGVFVVVILPPLKKHDVF